MQKETCTSQEICEILASLAESQDLKQYLNEQAMRAAKLEAEHGYLREYPDISPDEYRELAKNTHWSELLPACLVRSGLAGKVTNDGYIYNPFIHRRHLPSKVLRRICSELLTLSGECNVSVQSLTRRQYSLVLDIQHLVYTDFLGMNLRKYSTVKEDWLLRLIDAKCATILAEPSTPDYTSEAYGNVSERETREWHRAVLRIGNRLTRFCKDEHRVCKRLIENKLFTWPSARYFMNGIKLDTKLNMLDLFTAVQGGDTRETAGVIIYLYEVIGLWSTITALYNFPEMYKEFLGGDERAAEATRDVSKLFDRWENDARFGDFLTPSDLSVLADEMYVGLCELLTKYASVKYGLKDYSTVMNWRYAYMSSNSLCPMPHVFNDLNGCMRREGGEYTLPLWAPDEDDGQEFNPDGMQDYGQGLAKTSKPEYFQPEFPATDDKSDATGGMHPQVTEESGVRAGLTGCKESVASEKPEVTPDIASVMKVFLDPTQRKAIYELLKKEFDKE